MQFLSRDLDVFQAEFDLELASEAFAHSFKIVALSDIRACDVNEFDYLRWIMVATSQGKPVGYCYFRHHIRNSESYIGHLYVDNSERGQGVASQLMNMSLDFIFSVLPNKVKIPSISNEHSESKLVDLLLHRACEQKKRDQYFDIEALAYLRHLK